MNWSTNIAVVAVAVALAGCGSEAKTTTPQKAPVKQHAAETGEVSPGVGVEIANIEVAIARYCVESTDPDFNEEQYGAAYSGMVDAVDRLVAVYRAYPRQTYQTDDGPRTMRQVLSDNAGALERCDGEEQAQQLDRALDAGA